MFVLSSLLSCINNQKHQNLHIWEAGKRGYLASFKNDLSICQSTESFHLHDKILSHSVAEDNFNNIKAT